MTRKAGDRPSCGHVASSRPSPRTKAKQLADRFETSGCLDHQITADCGLTDRHCVRGGTTNMGFLGAIAKAFGREANPAPNTSLGRNEPCWCGSGDKYKRCHFDSDQRRIQSQKKTCCTTT